MQSKIFLDTAPIIYFIEGSPLYGQKIKTMDALQLAACIYLNCDVFLTNDKQLGQVTEVNSTMIESL